MCIIMMCSFVCVQSTFIVVYDDRILFHVNVEEIVLCQDVIIL